MNTQQPRPAVKYVIDVDGMRAGKRITRADHGPFAQATQPAAVLSDVGAAGGRRELAFADIELSGAWRFVAHHRALADLPRQTTTHSSDRPYTRSSASSACSRNPLSSPLVTPRPCLRRALPSLRLVCTSVRRKRAFTASGASTARLTAWLSLIQPQAGRGVVPI
jgi:hypothetical protein